MANGLGVLLYPDATKATVTVNITYRVGSLMESYGETGMAHLLEHLIFKGSKHYPHPDRDFNARGFRNNASTWLDRTNYFSTFQAGDDNLKWALGWTADAMTQSFIAKKDLDSEMTVVRNEFESGENQPSTVLLKRMQGLMYDWHNYGHSTIGNRADIENVAIKNLQAFYRSYYQPDNAVLVVAGRFDEGKTLRLIATTFGAIPRPPRQLPPRWTVEPTQDGERSVAVRRAGDVQLALVGYHTSSARSLDAGAIDAAATLLGDTPTGRLHAELVDKGLASQVFAFPMATRDPGLVLFGAVVKKGEDLQRARDALQRVVETTFAQQAPTDAELQRYRRTAETDAERALADPQQLGISLSEYIALGDWRLFFLARDRAATTTGDEIVAAAQHYFRRDNRTVGLFIPDDAPQRAEIPAPLPVANLLRDFKPHATVAAGESFDPSPQNIDRRTRIVHIGDLSVALLAKKTKGQTVNVHLAFRWGDEKTLFGRGAAEQLAAGMIGRGTGGLSRQQIADERTRLKIDGDTYRFETDRANLAEALRLTVQELREANFPVAEFDVLKRETLTRLQAQLSDPSARAREAVNLHFNAYPRGDVRYAWPLADWVDEVQKVTRDDATAFFHDFYGTARGQIAIVGDFDEAAVEPLLRETFAAWVSPAPYAPVLRAVREIAPARLAVDTPDKENATLRARLDFALRDDDPDYPALLLGNEIFGGGSGLSSRLVDRLRQKEGLSYSIGSGINVGARDRAASFLIAAIVAPQNAARAEQGMREELARWVRDGVTQKEVDDARSGLLQQRSQTRSDDGALSSAWVGYLDLDRTFAFSQQLEDRLRALTAPEVNAAIKRAIDPEKLTLAVAGDSSKGAR